MLIMVTIWLLCRRGMRYVRDGTTRYRTRKLVSFVSYLSTIAFLTLAGTFCGTCRLSMGDIHDVQFHESM